MVLLLALIILLLMPLLKKKKRRMKNLKFNLCQKKYKTDRELYDKVKKVIKFDLNRNQKDKIEFS